MFRNVWVRSGAVRQARLGKLRSGVVRRVRDWFGRRGTSRLGAVWQVAVRFGEVGRGWAGKANQQERR